MTTLPRALVRNMIGVGLALLACAGTSGFAKNLPDYDELDRPGKRPAFSPRASEQALLRAGTQVQVDDRTGLPTFVWAAERAAGAGFTKGKPRGEQSEQAARRHLGEYARLYRLDESDVLGAVAGSIHDQGKGAIIVAFQQRVAGIEVFRDEIKVMMDQDLGLVALSGYIPAARIAPGAGGRAHAFALDAAEAIASAMKDQAGPAGVSVSAGDLKSTGVRKGDYDYYDLDPATSEALALRLVEPARVKRVFFHLPESLEPAYYLELSLGSSVSVESDDYGYVISATDGRVLFRKNLTVDDSYTYRVWADGAAPFIPFDGPQGKAGSPHPTGVPDGTQPPFIAPSLVTLQNGPISTNDPWLLPAATQTAGNNADAYADVVAPDGLTAGDFRASTTSAGVFDRTYDTSLTPSSSQSQQMASITQLFFDINFLHDWFYDAGFNEASRNAQTSNFGRGGLENDNLRAEAQDSSGRNNANMSTPADGGRPRMQMYVWDVSRRAVTVNTPASIAGDYAVGTAAFGPAAFNVTNTVVQVNDGVAPGSDACSTPFTNAASLTGKIALIDRGGCTFAVKVKNAQVNGAVAVIVVNNTTGLLSMSGTDASITIPSLLVSQADGDAIRAQLGGGVNATLLRQVLTDRDGTIDNQIVAHEWGHYISNRLIGNASGLSNSQGRGMGEGWGDFHALLITVRPEDALAPVNTDWAGVYAIATYALSGSSNGPEPDTAYYFGLRRYPYSTDPTKNPLTFKHIGNGVPLPVGPPLSYGADGSNNSQVHNTGEVWTQMLWECYAGLLRDTQGGSPRLTFDQARDRIRNYLVAAYKTTPNAPTFLEARDALLASAAASDPNDYVVFWKAFAKRGAGFGAVSPDRSSTGNVAGIESFQPGVDLVFTGATLTDAVSTCDNDGVLDNTETGRLTIMLQNAGGGSYSSTTATITSTNPHVSFPGGGNTVFPAVGPSGTTTASVDVTLNGAVGVQQLDFDIAFDDPGFILPGPRHVAFSRRGHFDDVAGQTAADDVESAGTPWTITGNGSLSGIGPWRRQEIAANDHLWRGPDPFAASDQYLVSPVVNVAPTGTFGFTFRHRWFFEFQANPVLYFDGGVIELSTDGGSSWVDIGASASPGYGGVLATGGGNPLGGRSAFVQISPGYPGFVTTTVSLGTAYQGQAVRVRFRIGTDAGGDNPGWDVDDISFNNVTNQPFRALLVDRALCVDSDGDTFADRDDCAPSNAALWASPSEALDLDLSASGVLTWSAPTQPGAVSLAYDLLRSTVPSSFTSATCVESDDFDLSALDPSAPAGIFYYLVRSQNGCGGSLGTDSSGIARTGVNCP